MLSTLVLMPPLPGAPSSAALGALVRTLVSLVPATVEGVVRDVTVLAPGADDGVRRVTDHAGCALVACGAFEAAFAQALGDARSERLFILRAGAAFDRGFVDEIAMLLGPTRSEPETVWLLRESPDGMLSRLLPARAPVAGVIARRDTPGLAAPVMGFADLVRRLRRARTVSSRASMAS